MILNIYLERKKIAIVKCCITPNQSMRLVSKREKKEKRSNIFLLVDRYSIKDRIEETINGTFSRVQ